MSTVRWSSWPSGDRQVERDGRLADAALRREDAIMTRVLRRCVASGLELLAHAGDPGHQVEAGERHRQDAVDARARVDSTGFWGTVSTMTGTPSSASWICSTSLGPLSRPWSSASTSDDVGALLADRGERPAAVVDDVEQLDRPCAFSRPRMYCATCGTSSTISRRV